MNGMWISFESILRGQHFYNSVRIALGLLFIAIIFSLTNDLRTAAAVTSGALCVSHSDTPSPWRHKISEVLAGWVLATAMYSLSWFFHSNPFAMAIFIFIACFFLAFSPLYGKKFIPISFSGAFAIVLSLGSSAFGFFPMGHSIVLFIYGGACYCVYSLISSLFFVNRLKVQIFAECSFEIAKFLRMKALFYEEDIDFESLHLRLVRQISQIVEKSQTARDFIFRNAKTINEKKLAQLLILEIDLFETLMAGNTDYELLQEKYSGSEIMLFMRDLMTKMSRNMEFIAISALRGKVHRNPMSFKAELFAIEHYLERLSHDPTQDINALSELLLIFEKVSLCTEKIEEIKKVQASSGKADSKAISALNLMAFTSSYKINFPQIRKQFSFTSPQTRYAFRAALAMEAGFIVSLLMNVFSGGGPSRSYWIFLTISVVLRANFSTTAQRRTDRIIGTALGCVATALLLYLNPPAAILIFFLFLAQVGIRTFNLMHYKLASAAASVVGLVQITFLNPGQPFAFTERIVDTAIGAAIAYIASFVLPSWESRNIPQLMREVSKANAHYMRVVLTFEKSDESYRLARKKMLDALANLSDAFNRMQKEPSDKRIAVQETGKYIKLNYLFSARISSISLLLTRMEEHFPKNGILSYRLNEARKNLDHLFKKASTLLEGVPAPVREIENPEAEALKDEPAPDSGKAELFTPNYSEQRVLTILEQQINSASILLSAIEEVDTRLIEEWHNHHVELKT